MDRLNWIGKRVYYKGSVTSEEEAQQTLDGLKSRGFLWDQDGHLTEDARVQTLYRVMEAAVTGQEVIGSILGWMYRLFSVSTAVRYLRSQGYTRKSGEKCVIGYNPDCDTALIRLLQMDILTHVTMEDTGIYDEVSRICKYEVNEPFCYYIQS
jgi:hypothetical protein